MKLSLALVLSWAVLMIPGIASADGEGLMLGGGVYATSIDDEFDRDNIEDFFDDKSTGIQADIGWRFNKWIAVDAGYWDLGEFKSDRDGNGNKAKIDITTFTVGGIVSVPLWVLDIYARGGAAFWDADSRNYDDDGTDPFYGVGVALNIGGSLDIYLEVNRFDLETDVDMAGLGVRWTF
jgi:hypothetical protein